MLVVPANAIVLVSLTAQQLDDLTTPGCPPVNASGLDPVTYAGVGMC